MANIEKPSKEEQKGYSLSGAVIKETSQPETGRQLTYGEKAVGLSFNPSGDGDVNDCKMAYAKIIDQLDYLRKSTEPGEQKRLYSIAITQAQESQMWCVKAITWRD